MHVRKHPFLESSLRVSLNCCKLLTHDWRKYVRAQFVEKITVRKLVQVNRVVGRY